jgi:hypothetical protein
MAFGPVYPATSCDWQAVYVDDWGLDTRGGDGDDGDDGDDGEVRTCRTNSRKKSSVLTARLLFYFAPSVLARGWRAGLRPDAVAANAVRDSGRGHGGGGGAGVPGTGRGQARAGAAKVPLPAGPPPADLPAARARRAGLRAGPEPGGGAVGAAPPRGAAVRLRGPHARLWPRLGRGGSPNTIYNHTPFQRPS